VVSELPTQRGQRECARLFDLVVEGVHVAREEGQADAPIWLLLDATFLKRSMAPIEACRDASTAGGILLLGSDARTARPHKPRVDDDVGAPVLRRWAVSPTTKRVRIGFGAGGAHGSPADVLEVDLERGVATVVTRSAPGAGAGSDRDVAKEWLERAHDPDGYAIRRELRDLAGKRKTDELRRLLCTTSGAAGGSLPEDTLFGHPGQELRHRACVDDADPSLPRRSDPEERFDRKGRGRGTAR
jgi:hypothetical protein